MALQCGRVFQHTAGQCSSSSARRLPAPSAPRRSRGGGSGARRGAAVLVLATATGTPDTSKTIITKTAPGDMPFPWSEKDPYKLPVAIERVQKLLITKGWEKAWVEQIVDRIMKGMLKTTEERAVGVIEYLSSLGLAQDEICNMASISVVLLGLNPDTRLRAVVGYLEGRGVPADLVGGLVLQHPRIFEYKPTPEGTSLSKGKARIQVDVLPLPTGEKVAAVNYFREGASFLTSPVSPMPPMSAS